MLTEYPIIPQECIHYALVNYSITECETVGERRDSLASVAHSETWLNNPDLIGLNSEATEGRSELNSRIKSYSL